MKKTYPISPCPWCRKTPQFFMLIENTWQPHVRCKTYKCKVNPKSKHCSIRKKQKNNPKIIQRKIEIAINYWNKNNPLPASEGILLDFIQIANDANLGTKDHPLNTGILQ